MKTFKSYLIKSGYYNSLKEYLGSNDDLTSWGETLMMNHGNKKLIRAYFSYHSLRDDSHLELVKLDDDLTLEYISKYYRLSEEAIIYLIENNDKHYVLYEYIKHYSFQKPGYYPRAEIKMLESGDDWLIRQYVFVQNYGLFAEAQIRLIELNYKDLIELFLEYYTPCLGACEKIVETKNKTYIRKALAKTAFHEYDCYPGAEVKLVELSNLDLFREYIAKYHLFDESIDALLVPGRELMLLYYLSNYPLEKYEHRAAASRKQDPMLLRLIFQRVPLHHKGYYPEAEINLVKLGNKGLIYEYLDKWDMFEEGAEALVKLNDFDLTKTYISKYPLYGVAALELADQNNPDLIRFYETKWCRYQKDYTAEELVASLDLHNFWDKEVFAKRVKKLLAMGKPELIKAYVASPCGGQLFELEYLLLDLDNKDLTVTYVKWHGLWFEDNQLRLFESGDKDYITAHIEPIKVGNYMQAGHPFRGKALVKFLELEDDDLLKKYIDCWPLHNNGEYAEAEIMFLQHKNQELVKAYIIKYGLFDESITALFKLKNKMLLEALVGSHELGHVGHQQLLMSQMPDLIKIYMEKYKINPYFHDLAVRTRDKALIRTLMKAEELHYRGFTELAMQGFFDIMNEHVAKYGFPVREVHSAGCYSYAFPEEAEFKFVASGERDLIRKYVQNHTLRKKSEDKLAELGDIDLVQFYLSCKEKNKE